MKSKVYFSREITSSKVLELYKMLDKTLEGRVAIKVHSGEKGNQNFLKPEFWEEIITHVGGTVVECNTAYKGERNTTEKHKKLIEYHGWSKKFPVEILDAEGDDVVLDIPEGKVIKKNYIGKGYNSILFSVSNYKECYVAGGQGDLVTVKLPYNYETSNNIEVSCSADCPHSHHYKKDA